MVSDPAHLDLIQIIVSVLAVVSAAVGSVAVVLRRGIWRRAGAWLLCVSAAAAVASWLRFGQLHTLPDLTGDQGGRSEVTGRHRPLQFHEFFHYYLGAKYFSELGYLGLYDCTALADGEMAAHDGVPPRVTGFVRDLGDVLADKPVADARSDCGSRQRSRFSTARWVSFEADLRELRSLVPDGWWQDVVDDKGLNPPPTFMLLAAAVANAVPIRAAGLPTYAVTTSIDLILIVAAFVAVRRSFGASAAALAAVTFGASFLASYGWLGGAVLRFSWVTAIVLSLTAMRRDRWLLAGLLLGWAICDRVFPVGFAVGAALPLAVRAIDSARARRRLVRLALGVGATVIAAGLASVVVFGLQDWQVFGTRLARDSRVHNVLLMGLDKIVTFRSWVPDQDFHGHEGLARFRHWNERLDETWDRERVPVALLQIGILFAVAWVARKRRPFESCVLVGVVAMFTLASPASYYYCVLAVVPALLLRSALRASGTARWRELGVLVAFEAFWLLTLVAPRIWPDPIVCYLAICIGLGAFLAVWVTAWSVRTGRGASALTAA
jgi:hypothetical protein